MSNTAISFELTIYIAGEGARINEDAPSLAGHIWYGLRNQSRSFGLAPVDRKLKPLPVDGRR